MVGGVRGVTATAGILRSSHYAVTAEGMWESNISSVPQ